MKKMILIATTILGTAAASHAGVHFDFGVNVPLPGEIISGHREPAPVIYPAPAPVISQGSVAYQAPDAACAAAPAQVYGSPVAHVAPAPAYFPPPAPVCAPPVVITPHVYYPPRHNFYAWRHEDHPHRHSWARHDDRGDWHRR